MKDRIFTWKHLGGFYLVQMDKFLMSPLKMWKVDHVTHNYIRSCILSGQIDLLDDNVTLKSLITQTENEELDVLPKK